MARFISSSGSLFYGPSSNLVNPVNVQGVAGKGLAKEFKERYPFSYNKYRAACKNGKLDIGSIFSDTFWEPQSNPLFGSPTSPGGSPQRRITVYYVPTKREWWRASSLVFLQKSLMALQKDLQEQSVDDIAIPSLGCGNGQLDWSDVRPMIEEYLRPIPNLKVYLYPPGSEKSSSTLSKKAS